MMHYVCKNGNKFVGHDSLPCKSCPVSKIEAAVKFLFTFVALGETEASSNRLFFYL